MAAGVATNSKGTSCLYPQWRADRHPGRQPHFAHGGSSLYEFGPDGKFIRQIGKQVYGFLAAQQVRVDKNDNIWVVDRYCSMVIQLRAGRPRVMLLRRSRVRRCAVFADTGRGNPPGAGRRATCSSYPPMWPGNGQGNILSLTASAMPCVAKFTRDGVFVKAGLAQRQRRQPVQYARMAWRRTRAAMSMS